MINEEKFYRVLEDVFTGANIKGDSGYINLLNIKHNYYKIILERFKQEIDANQIITSDSSFKEELFDKLHSFFNKYFSESGSVYFVKTDNWQKVYEQVYTDNRDVILFWKTNMLYYVKSDMLFKDLDLEVEDKDTKQKYHFFFDVSKLALKQNNEKKDLLFSFRAIKQEAIEVDDINAKQTNNNGQKKVIYIFDISYSAKGAKNKLDDIVKETSIPLDIINKAFRVFKQQSEVDFFINKNAKKFLSEQLDLYLHQILLNDENKFEEKRLGQIKTIKSFAQKIIEFIAQFEDELVRVWNKPKFVLNSDYVISIDKLSKEIIQKISQHKNLKEQIKEWQELGIVDDKFNPKDIGENGIPYLPIDTKYFPDLKFNILALFDDLDNQLDGWLIKSENYQALNTILPKFKEKVQTIYIDPPFNTDSLPIIYVNKYKDSSWLSMISNRMEIAKKFLSDSGIHITSIDDNELRYLTAMQDQIFGKPNYITTITTKSNPQGRVAKHYSQTTEQHVIHSIDINKVGEMNVSKKEIGKPTSLKRTGTNSRREERPNRYYPILTRGNKIYMISIDEYKKIYDQKSKEFNDYHIENLKEKYLAKRYNFILPLGNNGEKLVWQRTFNRVMEEKDHYTVKNGNIFAPALTIEKPKTLWDNSFYSNPEYGSEYLTNMLGHPNFGTPKSYHTIMQFLSMGNSRGGIFLDYFAGSGTTAQATLYNNRLCDNTHDKNKYILIEMGEHFYNVILPRLKKLSLSNKWKTGKPMNKEGISQFFKYYELEQYENTLRKMKYKSGSPTAIWDTKNPFGQYIFYADEKFADVLNAENGNIKLDFDKLYPNIDFAETLSNLLGLPIKRVTAASVTLADGDKEQEFKMDHKKMSDDEKLDFVRRLKPLLWWGN